jgi:hypothetical protein
VAWKGQAPSGWQQGFRQDITYEQIIKEQIKVCLDALNSRDQALAEDSIKALSALITPRMQDDEFIQDVETLDAEWVKSVVVREAARRKRLAAARNGCPDLVAPISRRPDMNHLTKQLAVIIALLERKKMLLRLEVEESI